MDNTTNSSDDQVTPGMSGGSDDQSTNIGSGTPVGTDQPTSGAATSDPLVGNSDDTVRPSVSGEDSGATNQPTGDVEHSDSNESTIMPPLDPMDKIDPPDTSANS
jgi:hypothetical protein